MSVRTFALVLAGLAVGVVAAMCGIGGGLFVVPLLHSGFRVPLRAAVGTALFFVLPTALASTVAELFQEEPRLVLALFAPVGIAALIGVQAGYAVSRRLTPRRLKVALAVVLAIAGVRLLLGGTAPATVESLGELPISSLVAAFAVGLGGGFVAPIFGIGGGLVMVPGLALLVPGVDFATARATSLAVAILGASRSAWLYRNEEGLRPRLGLCLAIGAVAGAFLGVSLVHRPGWADAARILFGSILLFVSVRFAREARAAAAASEADAG